MRDSNTPKDSTNSTEIPFAEDPTSPENLTRLPPRPPQVLEISSEPTSKYTRAIRSLLIGTGMLIGGLLLFRYGDWARVWTESYQVLSSAEALREFVASFGPLAPLIFLLVQAFQVVAGPIPAAPVIAAGGAAFGFWPGLALSLTGLVAGSMTAFWLGRLFGKPMLIWLLGKDTLTRYASKPDGSRGRWLLVTLLLPVPATGDAACALAGASSLTLGRFVAVVTLGRLPGTAFAAFLGSGVAAGSHHALAIAGIVGISVLILTLSFQRRLESWLLRSAGGAKLASSSKRTVTK